MNAIKLVQTLMRPAPDSWVKGVAAVNEMQV